MLKVKVNEGQRLPGNLLTAMAPKYCVCKVGSEKSSTVAVKGKQPDWKQELTLYNELSSNLTNREEKLYVEVWEKNVVQEDSILGRGELDLASVYIKGSLPPRWVMLKTQIGGYGGKVEVGVEWTETKPLEKPNRQSLSEPIMHTVKPVIHQSSSNVSSTLGHDTAVQPHFGRPYPNNSTHHYNTLQNNSNVQSEYHSTHFPSASEPTTSILTMPTNFQDTDTPKHSYVAPTLTLNPASIQTPNQTHNIQTSGYFESHLYYNQTPHATLNTVYPSQHPGGPLYYPGQMPQQQHPYISPSPYQPYPHQNNSNAYNAPFPTATVPYQSQHAGYSQYPVNNMNSIPYAPGFEQSYGSMTVEQLATLPYPPPGSKRNV